MNLNRTSFGQRVGVIDYARLSIENNVHAVLANGYICRMGSYLERLSCYIHEHTWGVGYE